MTEVIEGGVAQQAGITLGDGRVKVNGKAVTTREEYMEAMQAAGAGIPHRRQARRKRGRGEAELPRAATLIRNDP